MPGRKYRNGELRAALKASNGSAWVSGDAIPLLRNPRLDPALSAEMARLEEMTRFEFELAGHVETVIAGVDEAGRGPLAGPVVAAALILPPGRILPGINDSKQLTEEEREDLFEELTAVADFGIGIAGPLEIDTINILQATLKAMAEAVANLRQSPGLVVADAVTIPGLACPQKPVIRGDALCVSVAAASIVAKVTRDRLMRRYHHLYPQYGFAHNKGYGTAEHIEALARFGPCSIHRRSFHVGGEAKSHDEINKGKKALECRKREQAKELI